MHVRNGGLPLWQQGVLDILAPPVGAVLWWCLSGGWVSVAQRGSPTARSLRWLNRGFWVILVSLYFLMFGLTIYAWFF